MKRSNRKRHRPEEVVTKLRQADEALAKGTPIAEVARSLGVSEVTLHRRRVRRLRRRRRRTWRRRRRLHRRTPWQRVRMHRHWMGANNPQGRQRLRR